MFIDCGDSEPLDNEPHYSIKEQDVEEAFIAANGPWTAIQCVHGATDCCAEKEPSLYVPKNEISDRFYPRD